MRKKKIALVAVIVSTKCPIYCQRGGSRICRLKASQRVGAVLFLRFEGDVKADIHRQIIIW